MAEDKPIAYRYDGSPIYDNAPTVVCVIAAVYDDSFSPDIILGIRRKSGLLGLPGGFQMRGESWQEAGIRETFEETGYNVRDLELFHMETDEYGHNVVFADAMTPPVLIESAVLDGEALEVLHIDLRTTKAEDWEFPLHYETVKDWWVHN